MALARGFKADAERRAEQLRAAVGAPKDGPLDLDALAAHVGATIVSADELVPIERLQEIENLQAFAFSACTFEVADRLFVVYNPLRKVDRRASDIAHELAHLILEHELSEIQYLDGIAFRTCRADQEEEATTLGGAILLPRSILLTAAKAGDTHRDVARAHGVTEQMARYRWNTTGVDRQAGAGSRR